MFRRLFGRQKMAGPEGLLFDGDLNDDETVAEVVTKLSERIHELVF